MVRTYRGLEGGEEPRRHGSVDRRRYREIDPPWGAAGASASHFSGSPLADKFLLATKTLPANTSSHQLRI
jgi:hypothetical protein